MLEATPRPAVEHCDAPSLLSNFRRIVGVSAATYKVVLALRPVYHTYAQEGPLLRPLLHKDSSTQSGSIIEMEDTIVPLHAVAHVAISPMLHMLLYSQENASRPSISILLRGPLTVNDRWSGAGTHSV